jgi:hypothetical protein
MRKSVALFFSFFILSLSINAQQMSPVQKKKVDDLFKNKSVLYFEFTVSSSQEIASIAKIVTVDGARGMKGRGHATKEQFSKFIVKNYPYTVLPTPAGKGGKAATKPATKTGTKKKTTKK